MIAKRDNSPMSPRASIWLLTALAGLALLVPGLASSQSSSTVPSIELTGTIDPATEKWIGSALDQAADENSPLAIIRIDTPGGLENSMRAIVQDIIDAPMPVVVYVSPNGARAASAGAFITEAADVAAMAPQTNIGSASAITSNGERHRRHARAEDRERRRRLHPGARRVARARRRAAGADGHRGRERHRRPRRWTRTRSTSSPATRAT